MNSTLNNAIIFVVGAAIGSFSTWKYFKTKYERIANDEIAEMREYVNSKVGHDVTDTGDAMTEEDKEEMNEIISKTGYTNYSNTNNENTEEEEMKTTKEPYVIMPDQFSEYADYDTISLTYYADGVLASDDTDEIIENVDEVVGEDSLNHFGEFEDDSVYVRNDERKCDYEILRDNRTYTEVVGPIK